MISSFLKRYILLLISLFIFSFCKAEIKNQHIKAALRSMGHEFLLQMDDSTSRILPITMEGGRFKIAFEKEFDFKPAMLSFALYKVFDETMIVENYIVEVEKCGIDETVYSFEISSKRDDRKIPCQSRALPNDCYIIYFTVIENENANTGIAIEIHENNADYKWDIICAIVLLLITIVVILYFKRRKNSKGLNPNLIEIGKYQFDKKGMRLTLKKQEIELSSKESDLLFLLFSNENKTLEREYLLNIVWGDEGDYVGRTLDVFISKLRKKLESDPTLKIINIRGVGYRFVIENRYETK